MKLFRKISAALFASLLLFTAMSCVSVDRIDADKDVELDGYWSDYDVKLVCNDIIDQVIASPRIAKKEKEMGRTPIVTYKFYVVITPISIKFNIFIWIYSFN